MKKNAIIFSLLALLFGCSKVEQSLAAFELEKNTFDVDEIINIKDLSTANSRQVWNYGDGTTSTSFKPTHKYSKSGDYVITVNTLAEGGYIASFYSVNVIIRNGHSKFQPYLKGDFKTFPKGGGAPVVQNNYNLWINTNQLYPNKLYFFVPEVNFASKLAIGLININNVTFENFEDSISFSTLGPNTRVVFKDANWTLNPDTKVLNIAYSLEIKNADVSSNNGTTKYTFESKVQ